MRVLVLSAMALALVGCGAPDGALSTTVEANKTLISLIANIEGCKVYRIEYSENAISSKVVHTTICPGAITTSENKSCGKGCIREHQVSTVRSEP